MYAITYQKTLLHKLLLLVFKIVKRIPNKEFLLFCEWFIDNKLSVNFGDYKTKAIFFC